MSDGKKMKENAGLKSGKKQPNPKLRKRKLPEKPICYSIEKFLENHKPPAKVVKEDAKEKPHKKLIKAKEACLKTKSIQDFFQAPRNLEIRAIEEKKTEDAKEQKKITPATSGRPQSKERPTHKKQQKYFAIAFDDSNKVQRTCAALRKFKAAHPECIKNNKISYPLQDFLLREAPEIHNFVPLSKPCPDPLPGAELAADLLEIWSFCMTFNKPLGLPKCTFAELYKSLNAETEEEALLVTYLLQSFIDAYVKDVKGFSEKELYSGFAILLLELSDYLHMCPVEAVALIFRVKKYRKCIAMPALNNVLSMVEKYEGQGIETKMTSFSVAEKKELLLALVKGLCVVDAIRENMGRQLREQRREKQEEKRRRHLERAIQPARPDELSPERRKALVAKQKELARLDASLKRRKVASERLGADAEGREYWVFAEDRERLYVRGGGKWGSYSTKEQLSELLKSLSDKGILESKLKEAIVKKQKILMIAEDAMEEKLPYNERLRGSKKKFIEKREISMTTYSLLISHILELEEAYHEFLAERNLKWETTESIRNRWREEAKALQSLIDTKKWILQFALNSMQPISYGTVPKAVKAAIRAGQEYDFEIEDFAREEARQRTSLKGLVWKDLGEAVCAKWLEYVETLQNSNELGLACKLLERRLEVLYQCIRVEEEKAISKAKDNPSQLNLKAKKIVNYEEQHLPSSAVKPLEKGWNDECYMCGEGGKVLCCDTCPNVVHLQCIGLKEAPDGMWQCENCRNKLLAARQTRSKAKKLQKVFDTYN